MKRKFFFCAQFFPIFLLIGFLNYYVNRWSLFMKLGYSIQGRMQDVGLLVGGGLTDVPEARKSAFKIYRLLNLAHMLTYKVSALMCASSSNFQGRSLTSSRSYVWRRATIIGFPN